MSRAPAHGGKSRLANAFAPPDLIALRTALFLDATRVALASGFATHIFVTPDDAIDDERELLVRSGLLRVHAASAQVRFHRQGTGDLGVRMRRAIADLISAGCSAAIVIGTDVPLLTTDDLASALAMLDDDTVVLGPATDGGYYLVATSRDRPDLFANVPWGGPDVFATTVRGAEAIGLRIASLRALPDLDTIEDLEAISAALAGTERDVAPALRQWLATRATA